MSQDSIKKSGYLEKLPVKGLMKKWNRRWFVLYATSHEGVVRLEYYDSRETFKNGVGKRTIPMRDGRSLSIATSTKLHPYVFQFNSQIGHHVLAADSQPELEEWMECIKNVCQEDRLKRRRTKGQSMVVTSDEDILPSFSDDTGMSYKNRVDSGTYRVTIEENETSIKMALSGTYSLELYPTMLSLVAPSGAKIFTLPYKNLKNYGKQSGKFHFETGKNSPIGIGKLLLVTSCSKEVFGVVHNNIKKMREDQQGGNPKPPPPKPDKYQPSQAIPRPQAAQSVEQPPLPKKTISASSRPTSDALDTSVAGTYRLSTEIEETSNTNEQTSTSPLYSTVDMSKKKNYKQQQQQQKKNDPPKPPQPYSSTTEDPAGSDGIYSDPYEEDPAYRANQSNGIDNLRASVGLVEMEDNAFGDSFDDDDDDDEPLPEGASNPLNNSNMVDFGEGVHHKQSVMSAESIAADLATLDFGFGPGNVEPVAGDDGNPDNLNFNFGDFGGDAGLPLPSNNDPFNSNFGATATGDLADFDLGKLDANFFEKLDAIDQQPSW